VNAVREDPLRKGLLYAGTERGVSVSFDDGDHWQSLQMNLPVTSVRDIDVHGNDLVIATHGRAFWVMDNMTPLRQTVDATPFLFKPATALRERPAGFTGTPMPKDEALAPNPPFGAYIDYVGSGASTILEIFDANDQLVRRYSTEDRRPAPDLARLTTAPEWFVAPSHLETTPGMHRFVWPIRYAAPAGVGVRRGGGEGVWAPPGNYKVVLTVGDRKLTQPLTVTPDPRINLPASAYAEQFALAKQIEQTRAAIAAAMQEATALTKDKPDLAERVKAITGGSAGDAFPPPPAPPNSLRFIDGALAKVASAVDSADAAPTRDARDAWAKLKPAADAALAAWKAFRQENGPK
jgi:hypothetical protein